MFKVLSSKMYTSGFSFLTNIKCKNKTKISVHWRGNESLSQIDTSVENISNLLNKKKQKIITMNVLQFRFLESKMYKSILLFF